jgi:hypothetical protein
MTSPLGYLGTPDATTTIKGKVELATVAETTAGTRDDLACTPAGVAAVAIAGAPSASTTQAGIIELATNSEAVDSLVTDRAITPSNIPSIMADPGAIGGTTPAAGTFTDLTADSTGAISLDADAASHFAVAGAGVDLTLESAAGRVVINGEEAAADAVRIVSAAGGLDVDTALLLSLTSSRNNAQAIFINATAGGIDITAAGAAGEDLDLACTSGSLTITAGEAAADSIVISSATGGMDISVGQDLDITATGAGITIQSTESAADSIKIESTLGGIDILASGAAAGEDIDIIATGSSVNIESTEDAALALYLHANGGTSETIRIRADQGTGVNSIDILSDVGGVTITAGLATADAINIVTSNAAGGIDVDAGTAGFIVDTTGGISLDAAAASNFTATGAFDITVSSTAGSINISGGEAATDAINIDAAAGGLDVDVALQMNLDSAQAANTAIRINASDVAGGIDIDAGTGGIAIDTTGALSLDSAAASNFTVTGAFDLTLNSSAGSIVITGAEAAIDAIDINASDVAGGIDIDAGTGGITIDTTGTLSLDSAGATNLTATGAFDITIQSTAGSVIVSASESAVDALQLLSTAGGIDILASGAAAGEDIDIIATGSSINITSTENVTDAIVITASGAASAVQLDAGTGSFRIGTGLVIPVTAVNNAASPYTVLGTDYFLSVDTSGGAVTVTLPAATALAGRTFVIRDMGGNAAVNNITIGGGGTNLVGGGAAAASKTLSAAYSGATVYSNGTTWAYAYVA